jgi:hypothetical protein
MKRRLEAPEDAAARLQAEALTPSERVFLWERIQTSRDGGRPSRMRSVAIAVGACASLAAVALIVFLTTIPQEAEKPAVVRAACRLDPVERVLELPSTCETQSVRVGQDEWLLMPGTKIARIEDGARVVSGRVEFRVHPRSPSDFRVHVSAGHQVRVVGTVFRIEQEGASGSVSVNAGVIEFLWSDGERQSVPAGQTLHWPRRVAASPPAPIEQLRDKAQAQLPKSAPSEHDTPEADSSAPQKSAAPAPDLESLMDRVLQLKSQRRFGELIALLERTLGSPDIGPVQRERLSYELGLALQAAGRNPCDHWKRHAQTYGAGRHRAAVASQLERCKP